MQITPHNFLHLTLHLLEGEMKATKKDKKVYQLIV